MTGRLRTPRGYRNNNPLNIRRTETRWQGQVDGDDKEFCSFASPVYGWRAALIILMRTYRKRGWNTYLPEFKFTTDNAAMIALAGYYHYKNGERCSLDVAPVSRAAEL